MVTQAMTGLVAMVAEQTHRLARALPRLEAVPQAAAVRLAVRKLSRELESAGVQFVELTGQTYDPGFAVDVVECRGDASAAKHVIAEMVTPIVLWNGVVLRRGEAVLEGMAAPRKPCAWQAELRKKRRGRRGRRRPPNPRPLPITLRGLGRGAGQG